MAITYTIKNDGSLVHAIGTGELSTEDSLAYIRSLAGEENLKVPHDTLLDLNDISTISVQEEDLKKISDLIQTNPAKLSARKFAVVAHQSKIFALGNSYQNLEKSFDENTIVFNDIKTAIAWLGITSLDE